MHEFEFPINENQRELDPRSVVSAAEVMLFDPAQGQKLYEYMVEVPFQAITTFYTFIVEEMEMNQRCDPHTELGEDSEWYTHEDNSLALLLSDIEKQLCRPDETNHYLRLNMERLSLLGEIIEYQWYFDEEKNKDKYLDGADFYAEIVDACPYEVGNSIKRSKNVLLSQAGITS